LDRWHLFADVASEALAVRIIRTLSAPAVVASLPARRNVRQAAQWVARTTGLPVERAFGVERNNLAISLMPHEDVADIASRIAWGLFLWAVSTNPTMEKWHWLADAPGPNGAEASTTAPIPPELTPPIERERVPEQTSEPAPVLPTELERAQEMTADPQNNTASKPQPPPRQEPAARDNRVRQVAPLVSRVPQTVLARQAAGRARSPSAQPPPPPLKNPRRG
jgi:hypothetical protein